LPSETFGDRLANARRKKGLSIEQVSDVLRIRRSIIEALESSAFTHMPLKGYSRNMVSSYARFVGLNSTELTEQFLREYREFENFQTRAKGMGYDYPSSARNDTSASRQGERRETIGIAQRNKGSRSYWATEDPAVLNRLIDPNSYNTTSAKRSQKRGSTPHGTINRNQAYNQKPRARSSGAGRNPVLFIIVLIIILIAILVGLVLLANSCSQDPGGLLPVEGGPSNGDNNDPGTGPGPSVTPEEIPTGTDENQDNTIDTMRYGPFDIRIEVVSDVSWLQVTVDGRTRVAQTCEYAWSETFRVEAEVKIDAGRPSNVRVYRNGVPVDFEYRSGIGFITLTVEEAPKIPNIQGG